MFPGLNTDNIERVKIGIAGCPKKKIQYCPHCSEELELKEESESIDYRLTSHRTLWPQLRIKFLVYTKDAALLEKCIKREFKSKIYPKGHEIIEILFHKTILESTQKYLDMFNGEEIEYIIEDRIDQYNENVSTMVNAV